MVKKLLIVFAIVLLGFSLAYAQGKGTDKAKPDEKAEAKALVEKAEAFAKVHGKEKCLAEISKSDGQFVKGDLYVFAYDMKGVVVAHPKIPKLIGQNLYDKPDSRGKLFRKEIIEKAKAEGSGWVDYFYLNPQTGKEEDKTTYFKKVGDVVIGCGAYK